MNEVRKEADIKLAKALQKSLPVVRSSIGINQKELADTLGVTRQTVINWEKERTIMTPIQELAMMALIQGFEEQKPGLGKIIAAIMDREQDGDKGEMAAAQTEFVTNPIRKLIADYIGQRLQASAPVPDGDGALQQKAKLASR